MPKPQFCVSGYLVKAHGANIWTISRMMLLFARYISFNFSDIRSIHNDKEKPFVFGIHMNFWIESRRHEWPYWSNMNRFRIYIYIYIYIKWTVFVNVTTKSAQHAHARMIAIIVEKSPNSSHMYDHGFMDNTNRQAVCKSQKNPLSDSQTAEELHWKP